MTSAVQVKICGIKTPEVAKAAIDAGARYLGFVFFPKSPRHVSVDLARDLAVEVPDGIAKVALVVNPSDEDLDQILQTVPIDILQLHGSETPDEVARIRARYGLPVMKALGVVGPEDLPRIDTYAAVADQLLIDAKPPKGADLPGGNGVAFDWRLVAGRRWSVPWMLAGGLTPENVAQAVALTGAQQIDVSTGVETAPGRKDPAQIAAFIRAATTPQVAQPA